MERGSLTSLWECERLVRRLEAEMERQKTDAEACLEGGILEQYLDGYEKAKERLSRIREGIVVLRTGASGT